MTDAPHAEHVQREVLDQFAPEGTTPGPGLGSGLLVGGHAVPPPGQGQRWIVAAAATTAAMVLATGLACTASGLALFVVACFAQPGVPLCAAGVRLQGRSDLVVGAGGDEVRGHGLGAGLDTVHGRERVRSTGSWPRRISRTLTTHPLTCWRTVLCRATRVPSPATISNTAVRAASASARRCQPFPGSRGDPVPLTRAVLQGLPASRSRAGGG